MEALGAFSDGEWDSLTTMFSSLQQLDQSLNNSNSTDQLQFPNNGGSETENHSWFYSLDSFDPVLQSGMSCSGSFYFPNFGSSFLSDVLMEDVDKGFPGAGDGLIHNGVVKGSQPPSSPPPPPPPPQLVDSCIGGYEPITLKRKVNNREFSKSQRNKTHAQKKKKIEEGKKNKKKKGEIDEEEGNVGALEGQSWISYSSEEENGSQEGHGGSAATSDDGVNGNGRASRGSATDPQSLYARKRRERINERLKILQNLVPNGTKVDISTMLEEAVHYVKFLQLQIKLLSSDDMWMFAPMAYNGMDIGLHQKLSPFLSH